MEGCGWGGRRRFKEGSRAGQQLTEEAIKICGDGEFELTVFAVIFEELDNMPLTINKLNIAYYTLYSLYNSYPLKAYWGVSGDQEADCMYVECL